MQDDISGWLDWQRNFSQIEEISSPSELHGLLTGIVCVTEAPSREQWQQILATLDIQLSNEDALSLLEEESEDVSHALAEDELDYLPMLPDDEHSLSERVQALADWCAGVVLGFGLASGHLRQDEQELIEHLQDVASVEFDDSDDDEEGEESYQELYEFVRLIPVSLAMGRKKVAIEETPLLQGSRVKTADSTSQVVEMFTPHRPS
ncbi:MULTISPECIES: UPF0149 family protein [unclassified Acinetobacter]|uniref:UPF0149 family protein n=1 Tax=unclassified Acinetobacter TaxID=196816 RepID=UPI002934E8B2|nr:MULTISPECIES: UPF0149 family protein [unclassified Acinetobacter]WOE31772.1 UPF0149 family protein [Acinetobacter sp. SAAs470]WOE37239.1 UPF0149 family protein [Acinetobacter sp. SAAs474]